MNKYKCTLTNQEYSEATIQANLSKAYRRAYTFEPQGSCEGCGGQAVCSAHIISKMRLKQLHLTSLIWSPELFFRSCYKCNQIAELPSSEAIADLLNYQEIKQIIFKYDPETASKLRR